MIGTKGALAAGNQSDIPLQFSDRLGCRSSPLQESFPQRFRQSFADELDSFIHLVMGVFSANSCIDAKAGTSLTESY